MNYCLRKAAKTDFDRINELFMEMIRSVSGKTVVAGYGEGDLDYYFTGGEDWICVAEIGGTIAGFLSIEVHREQENYLYYDDFCVSAPYRGGGIGSALMKRAEDYCRRIGFAAIVLHVEKSNLSARSFYENRGFSVLRDDGTRLCMVKRLEQVII